MNTPLIWLIGASAISQDYALVLTSLKKRFDVICRSESQHYHLKIKQVTMQE